MPMYRDPKRPPALRNRRDSTCPTRVGISCVWNQENEVLLGLVMVDVVVSLKYTKTWGVAGQGRLLDGIAQHRRAWNV